MPPTTGGHWPFVGELFDAESWACFWRGNGYDGGMINARLYRVVSIRGEAAWLYTNASFPAPPIDGQTIYVGRRGEEYEEVQVSESMMRSGDDCVHIWIEAIEWTEGEDGLEPDETLESWVKHFEDDFGWVRCQREPRLWLKGFSESWLLREENKVTA